jgi:hypothetical protein
MNGLLNRQYVSGFFRLLYGNTDESTLVEETENLASSALPTGLRGQRTCVKNPASQTRCSCGLDYILKMENFHKHARENVHACHHVCSDEHRALKYALHNAYRECKTERLFDRATTGLLSLNRA